MDLEQVIQIAKLLNADDVNIYDEWVMFNCPFAEFKHRFKVDTNPSFGININHNTYNCFSCHSSGRVETLPFQLETLYKLHSNFTDEIKKRLNELKIVITHGIKIIITENTKKKSYTPISFKLCELLEYPTFNYKYMTKEMYIKYLVFQIPETDIITFPIINHKKELIAFKCRNVRTGQHLYLKSFKHNDQVIQLPENKPKQLGIWYGEWDIYRKFNLILVEGERDRILLQHHLDSIADNNILALGSIGSKVTKEQINRLKKFGVKDILLFFDNDEAGELAREEVKSQVKRLFRLYQIKDYMGCNDPAEAYEKGKLSSILSKKNLKEV